MKNKTTRSLTISLISISVVCVLMFSFLANFLGAKNTEMISEIGTIYMTGMNERIEMHFETTIDTQLSQLEDIVAGMPEEKTQDYEIMAKELEYNAWGRNFQYLALYSASGEFEMITGEQVYLADPEPFKESMEKGDRKVAVGIAGTKEDIVLYGVKASLPMKNGENSIALVAGIPCDYIKRLLSLDENDSLVYSHVIRRDGTFVIRSGGIEKNNYFDQIRAIIDEDAEKGPEDYVQELQAAMYERENYSAVLYREDARNHLYCTSLPCSEWFLVTVMPYGMMDETVNHYSSLQAITILGCCGLILIMLVVVFVMYLKFSKRQIEELEKARQEAVHATRAKSEFLSNMSHDIRTPMNAIVGMTAIAAANIDDKKQVQNCLKKITLSSKHLLGLINDVLDMSKIESGKLTLHIEQISLREVMDSIVNIVQPQLKEKKQQFSVCIQDIEAEDVYGDSVRLNQVLLNFLSNAIKFTPEGGTIQIHLNEEASSIGDSYVRVHIRVKDNGIGMSPEFRKTIFDAFTREDSKRVQKTEGTGLGMAITKYIVDAMGGTIEVNSQPGEGTEFHVTLDMEKVLVQEEEMILPDWHMLVVDDDKQLCESATGALTDIGINAEWTLDGESAVELVAKRHIEQNDFQIILLDWKLPGMDGIETARKIRTQIGGETPILLISAYDWNEIEHDAKDAGITGFISKPLFKSTLFYGLRQFIESTDESETPVVENEINLTGKKVLLAEDNDLNWEIAEALLTERGLELEWAENGQICVDKFKESPVGFYDAILMDIRMPVMTGHEAARIIRTLDRKDADIPIIAMTADAFEEDIKKCMESGMNAHVAKPIDIREVEKQLDKYIKANKSNQEEN